MPSPPSKGQCVLWGHVLLTGPEPLCHWPQAGVQGKQRDGGSSGACCIPHISYWKVHHRLVPGSVSGTPQLCSQQHKTWLSRNFCKKFSSFLEFFIHGVTLLLHWCRRQITGFVWHSRIGICVPSFAPCLCLPFQSEPLPLSKQRDQTSMHECCEP